MSSTTFRHIPPACLNLSTKVLPFICKYNFQRKKLNDSHKLLFLLTPGCPRLPPSDGEKLEESFTFLQCTLHETAKSGLERPSRTIYSVWLKHSLEKKQQTQSHCDISRKMAQKWFVEHGTNFFHKKTFLDKKICW